MSYLFTHARFLNEDLSRWQTDRVTDMKYMFAFASGFRGSPGFLDDDDTSVQYAPNAYTLRNWNTEKVTDMSFMFHHAIAFTGEGLTHWDVQNVVDMT